MSITLTVEEFKKDLLTWLQQIEAHQFDCPEGATDTWPGMPIPGRKAFIALLAPKGQNGREAISMPPAQPPFQGGRLK